MITKQDMDDSASGSDPDQLQEHDEIRVVTEDDSRTEMTAQLSQIAPKLRFSENQR